MRLFLVTITVFLALSTLGGALEESPNDPSLIPGIHCYDYYFLGNKGFDISLFSGINPNATFIDKDDLLYYKGDEECTTYVVSEKADVNVFDPFFENTGEVDYSTDRAEILPDPNIMFVDEENIDFKQFTSGDTILYGGVLPFVALPDADLETEDKVLNEESFSLFFYFKQKF